MCVVLCLLLSACCVRTIYTGMLDHVAFDDPQARVDTWIAAGVQVSAYYDSLLAKMMVHGTTRQDALQRIAGALAATQVSIATRCT